jgi:acetate kinase
MIRARVAEKLAWLGTIFDPVANQAAKTVISQPESKVALYVVPTDEELMIARHTLSLLEAQAGQARPTTVRSALA